MIDRENARTMAHILARVVVWMRAGYDLAEPVDDPRARAVVARVLAESAAVLRQGAGALDHGAFGLVADELAQVRARVERGERPC